VKKLCEVDFKDDQVNLFEEEAEVSLYCEIDGKTIYEIVIDELDGEIAKQTRNTLHTHLLRCSACFDVYSRLKNIARVVRAYPENLIVAQASNVLLNKPEIKKPKIVRANKLNLSVALEIKTDVNIFGREVN
jgi:predicted anti-sigma-YlaC factor YlaD